MKFGAVDHPFTPKKRHRRKPTPSPLVEQLLNGGTYRQRARAAIAERKRKEARGAH